MHDWIKHARRTCWKMYYFNVFLKNCKIKRVISSFKSSMTIGDNWFCKKKFSVTISFCRTNLAQAWLTSQFSMPKIRDSRFRSPLLSIDSRFRFENSERFQIPPVCVKSQFKDSRFRFNTARDSRFLFHKGGKHYLLNNCFREIETCCGILKLRATLLYNNFQKKYP